MRKGLLTTVAALVMAAAPMAQADSHAQMAPSVIEEQVASSTDHGVVGSIFLLFVLIAILGGGSGHYHPL